MIIVCRKTKNTHNKLLEFNLVLLTGLQLYDKIKIIIFWEGGSDG